MERHIASSKEWFPHLYVPWSRGRDFEAERGMGPRGVPRARRRAGRPLREPPDRGQPALLLPHDRQHVRARRVGRVDPAVDGRGAAPLDRDPRLPDGDPGPRPGGAGAGPDGAGVGGGRARAAHAGRHPRLRGPPGAGHPGVPPQHRQAHRRPGGLRGHGPGRRRREPPLPVLPGPGGRGHRHGSVVRGAGHRAPGEGLRDAGDGHPQLRRQGGVDRPGRDLRPRPPPRPGPGAVRACATGSWRRSRACRPRPRRPAPGWWPSWPAWSRSPAAWPNAERPRNLSSSTRSSSSAGIWTHEAGAAVAGFVGPDEAAVGRHDLPADGQAEAGAAAVVAVGPAAGVVEADEAVEDVLPVLEGDTRGRRPTRPAGSGGRARWRGPGGVRAARCRWRGARRSRRGCGRPG